ncbi:RNA-directed DNA polymerase, eukaryota, nucleotide-binding alpha-beta plait domain protein [Tanacetum coccineum]
MTNFPHHVTTHDLWKVCNDYGVVVDAFIPYKKSNACKRFAFVWFIKVYNIDHLVVNLCTIWIGCLHLYVNVACFHREHKPSAPSHPSNANERNSPGSFVSILKSGKTNNVMSDQVLPSLILDDSCISNRDFSLSLMGKVKDITTMPNLYVILEKEGFQNLSLTYLGGLWVLIEMVSSYAKEKLLNHTCERITKKKRENKAKTTKLDSKWEKTMKDKVQNEGLGMEKTVKDKAKSKPESQSSQKVNRKVNWSKSKSTPGPKSKKYKFRG